MTWYNASWSKRKKITLTGNASGAQTDYQVKLTVTYDSDMKSDFSDLRFTKADGTTLLDAWMESHTASTSAIVWVETDTPANTVEADIYMYYGNSGASSDWDGDATFKFFDDFEGDLSKWTNESGGALAIVTDPVKIGSHAVKQYSTSTQESYASFTNQTSDFVMEFYARVHNSGARYRYIMIEKVGGSENDSVKLQWFQSTKLRYQSDSGDVEIMNVSMDTWYRFKIAVHPSTDTFDMWVDGVSKVTGGDVSGSITSGCSAISMYGYVTSADYPQYIDSVLMYKYVANPATYAFGSEEGAPTGRFMWKVNGGTMRGLVNGGLAR